MCVDGSIEDPVANADSVISTEQVEILEAVFDDPTEWDFASNRGFTDLLTTLWVWWQMARCHLPTRGRIIFKIISMGQHGCSACTDIWRIRWDIFVV